jgi:hypothetical protein
MKTYTEEDLPEWLKIVDQSEHFIFLRHWSGAVQISDMEALLALGLQCCGITSDGPKAIIGCLKIAPCGS